MTTIKEVIEERGNEVADIEIYKFTGCRHDIHNDFIKSVDVSHDAEIEIYDYEIMDEEYYERTVLANVDLFADFEEWYGDKNAKVLVIMLDEFAEVEDARKFRTYEEGYYRIIDLETGKEID